jgi:RNA polymerase sigma factor (sigma-70 family)
MPDVEALFREQEAHLRATLRRRFNYTVPDVLLEDACASAWAIAWAHRDRIPEENPMGWLVVVARNEAFALIRRRGRERYGEPPADQPAESHDPELAFRAREQLDLLSRLSPNQRLALGLRAAGYRYDEICELTGKTYTWTNRHVSEGRARLRELAAGG